MIVGPAAQAAPRFFHWQVGRDPDHDLLWLASSHGASIPCALLIGLGPSKSRPRHMHATPRTYGDWESDHRMGARSFRTEIDCRAPRAQCKEIDCGMLDGAGGMITMIEGSSSRVTRISRGVTRIQSPSKRRRAFAAVTVQVQVRQRARYDSDITRGDSDTGQGPLLTETQDSDRGPASESHGCSLMHVARRHTAGASEP